jgi:hypothetical protein
MKRDRKAPIVIVIAILLLILLWAPWMNDKQIHHKVLIEKGKIDHTVNESGEIICDYNVTWAPFGRMVGSCEGAHYVSFWGEILF